jgi:hypothetical protein
MMLDIEKTVTVTDQVELNENNFNEVIKEKFNLGPKCQKARILRDLIAAKNNNEFLPRRYFKNKGIHSFDARRWELEHMHGIKLARSYTRLFDGDGALCVITGYQVA